MRGLNSLLRNTFRDSGGVHRATAQIERFVGRSALPHLRIPGPVLRQNESRFPCHLTALVCQTTRGDMLMRRREFIIGIGGAAAWSLAAAAQQPRLPMVGFVTARSAAASERAVAAFRKGLRETGYVEDRNVIVEYHWLDGQFDQLPALMADLVRRRVAVIASPNNTLITIMAKAKTATIPIVFSVGIDPVKTGLVASFTRPAGNATGIHYFALELTAKRLGLLRALAPEATRVAILVNPANGPSADDTLPSVGDAARSIGLQTKVLNASASGEIDAAFATLAHERPAEGHPNAMLCH